VLFCNSERHNAVIEQTTEDGYIEGYSH